MTHNYFTLGGHCNH